MQNDTPPELKRSPGRPREGVGLKLVANVRVDLQHVARTAEQFPLIDRWAASLRYICDQIVGVGRT